MGKYAYVFSPLYFRWSLIYKPRHTDDSLDTDYRQDLINSNSKFFNAITDYANILINNLQSQLFVSAYYKGDRNLINITDIQNLSNQFFDRFDALKNALNASANFTNLAKSVFKKLIYTNFSAKANVLAPLAPQNWGARG